MQSIIIRN